MDTSHTQNLIRFIGWRRLRPAYNFQDDRHDVQQARIQGGFFGDWRTPPRLWKGPHFDFQFFSFSIIERAKNE